jgi:hypothetical protein
MAANTEMFSVINDYAHILVPLNPWGLVTRPMSAKLVGAQLPYICISIYSLYIQMMHLHITYS